MTIKELDIKWFWSKLLSSTNAQHSISDNFLLTAKNVRIYDGGIWPRKWKQIFLENSKIKNRWWFSLNGELYQILWWKIWKITTGTPIEIVDLWLDKNCDIAVFGQYAMISWEWAEMKVFNGTSLINPLIPRQEWASNISYITRDILANWMLVGKDFTGEFSNGNGYAIWDSVFVKLTPINIWTWNANVYIYWKITEIRWSNVYIPEIDWQQSWLYWVWDMYSSIAKMWKNISLISSKNCVEFCRNFCFTSIGNTLYISRPATNTNPEYIYDFQNSPAQSIAYNIEIIWLKWTMNGLYIFLEWRFEFLGANAMQNISGSSTFISQPLWEWFEPISNLAICSYGDKIFYLARNLNIQCINYKQGMEYSNIGEISSTPIVWITELLQNLDEDQSNCFAFVNESDKTLQIHCKTRWAAYNDVCIVYYLQYDTFSIDTWKNYNYIIKHWNKYYWFSDINGDVFIDNVWNQDGTQNISSIIETRNLILWNVSQKLFRWFTLWWWLDKKTRYKIKIEIFIDDEIYFSWYWTNEGLLSIDSIVWELSWQALSDVPIWWNTSSSVSSSLYTPFEIVIDEGQIFVYGTRIRVKLSSLEVENRYLFDMMRLKIEHTWFIETSKKL